MQVLNTGAYIPPSRLKALQQQQIPSDPLSEQYQLLHWEALKKSINGLINKVNASNIQPVVQELFQENLLRGRGLLVRTVMRAQQAAMSFTAVYAAMIALINCKLPQVGELLLTRLVRQFQRTFRRNDKSQCLAVTMFLGHLVNHHVAHEIVVLELMILLLERPTNDSVEIAVGLMREVGNFLTKISPKPCNAIFDRFRSLLQENSLDKRVQYMIEVLFQVRKDGFSEFLAIKPELDLIDTRDQIAHYITLDDESLNIQEDLNVFSFDPKFTDSESHYEELKKELLQQPSAPPQNEEILPEPLERKSESKVVDNTGSALTELRKVIYLTIMSCVDFEECGHKLLKLNVPIGLEIEVCNMIVECCSQERTFLKYYGLLAERFCKLNLVWAELFTSCFQLVYSTIHRLETNKIRNVAKLFSHLLTSEALSPSLLNCIILSEDETTSSSRIFIKFLFQDLHEHYGMLELKKWVQAHFTDLCGLFPSEPDRNVRFAYNFFVAIDLELIVLFLKEKISE